MQLKEEEELKDARAAITMVSFYAAIASLLCAAGAVAVVFYTVDMYWVVIVGSLLIDLSLWCWTGLVAIHLLDGVLLQEDHMFFMIYWGTVFLWLPELLLSHLLGQAIGVLVHLLGVMGLAWVLG